MSVAPVTTYHTNEERKLRVEARFASRDHQRFALVFMGYTELCAHFLHADSCG